MELKHNRNIIHCNYLDRLILRSYFEATRFTMRTDQNPLKWNFGGEATGKLERWRLRPQELDFKIEYVKEPKQETADAISRLKTNGGGKREDRVNVELAVFAIEPP